MSDYLSILVFVLAYGLGRVLDPAAAIYWATGAMMLVALGQLGWWLARRRPIGGKEALTLGAILLLGSITLIFRNPLIIKLKPTVVYLLIGLLFLLSPVLLKKNLTEKMLGGVFQLPAPLWARLNLAWVVFFFVEGGLNALVAYQFSEEFWLGFKLWGLLGLSLLFILGQFWLLKPYLRAEAVADNP